MVLARAQLGKYAKVTIGRMLLLQSSNYLKRNRMKLFAILSFIAAFAILTVGSMKVLVEAATWASADYLLVSVTLLLICSFTGGLVKSAPKAI